MAAAGALAGLGTNLYYQSKRHKLKKKLEGLLGQKTSNKEKVSGDLLMMAAAVRAEQLLKRESR